MSEPTTPPRTRPARGETPAPAVPDLEQLRADHRAGLSVLREHQEAVRAAVKRMTKQTKQEQETR